MPKIKLTENTKQQVLTLTLSGMILIVFFFLISHLDVLYQWLTKASSILISFILGFFIAFVLGPLNEKIEYLLFRQAKISTKAKRILSSIITLVLALVIFSGFILISLPQLIESVTKLVNILPDYLTMAEEASDSLLTRLNINQSLAQLLSGYSDELFNKALSMASLYLPQLLTYSIQLGSFILKFMIGLIIALYILIDKERFVNQFRKLNFAYLPAEKAAKMIEFSQVCSRVFNRFIVGKALDSMIIGVLAYVGLAIFNFPFALLLSVIIGVTNMIPVFGPFIGAIPGIFILFIVDPVLVIWFCLFVFVLQQLDGNFIGPAILGDSLGLPTLWIMFAIIVGGGFYGVLGMFFGVPAFAVIYFYLKRSAERRLLDKQIELE